ncbi:MAG: hypothetical protein FWD46_01095 [Cystobacterineae bacterium]|nr:hypothetical protein [Cystobacterineae bacterium]
MHLLPQLDKSIPTAALHVRAHASLPIKLQPAAEFHAAVCGVAGSGGVEMLHSGWLFRKPKPLALWGGLRKLLQVLKEFFLCPM